MGYETSERPKKQIGTFLFNASAEGLNPTAKELQILRNSQKEQKEQVYAKQSLDGVNGINLTFWLRGKFGLKPVFFPLFDCEAENKDKTKRVFIDEAGNDTFAESKDAITSQWVDKNTVRVAYRGERELTQFMRALLDRNPREIKKCRLDDVKKIIAGDLTEIKYFLKNFAKQACCLIYGDEKGYTNIWAGGFGGAYTLENEKFWTKKLGDSTKYGYPKGTVSIKVVDWDVKMDDDTKENPFGNKAPASDLDDIFSQPSGTKRDSPF